MDENRQAVAFAQHDEQLKILEINPAEITQARKVYSFLKDRLPDYAKLKS